MIHYHVWFSLKPDVPEAVGLGHARAFIAELLAQGQLVRGLVLKNDGSPPRSRLPAYHALFEFADDAQMDSAFSHRRQVGIHTGPHGQLLASVADFVVEVFREP